MCLRRSACRSDKRKQYIFIKIFCTAVYVYSVDINDRTKKLFASNETFGLVDKKIIKQCYGHMSLASHLCDLSNVFFLIDTTMMYKQSD